MSRNRPHPGPLTMICPASRRQASRPEARTRKGFRAPPHRHGFRPAGIAIGAAPMADGFPMAPRLMPGMDRRLARSGWNRSPRASAAMVPRVSGRIGGRKVVVPLCRNRLVQPQHRQTVDIADLVPDRSPCPAWYSSVWYKFDALIPPCGQVRHPRPSRRSESPETSFANFILGWRA